MARVYHRDQAGAPQSPSTNTRAADFSYFKSILIACLVDGYGAIEPAGWDLIANDAAHVVLRSPTSGAYACFAMVGSSAGIVMSLSATYSGVSNGVVVGDGAKSGVAAGNTLLQRATVLYLAAQSASSSWYLVGDERTFIFSFAGNATNSSPVELISTNPQFSNSFLGTLYCGEDANGNFITCGGLNHGSSELWDAFGLGFTSLMDPATGFLVGSGALSVSMLGIEAIISVPLNLAGVVSQCNLSPMAWFSGGVYGRFRGMCIDIVLKDQYVSAAAKALGRAAGITTRTLNSTIDLGDQWKYFCAAKYFNRGATFLVTDNEDFW